MVPNPHVAPSARVKNGNLRIVGHQVGRKGAFHPGKAVVSGFFLLGHAFGGAALQMRERQQDRLGVRVQREGHSAKQAAGQRHGQGEPEGADVTAKSLGEEDKEPVEQAQAMGLFARLMNLAVGAGHQRLPGSGASPARRRR